MKNYTIFDKDVIRDYEIRYPEEVAFRAICLSAMIFRGELEQAGRNDNIENLAILSVKVGEINKWLMKTEIQNFLTDHEEDLLILPFRMWDVVSDYDFYHYNNQLGTLLWALSLIRILPGLHQEFSRRNYMLTCILNKPNTFFEAIQTRSEEELFNIWSILNDIAQEKELETHIRLGFEENSIVDVNRIKRIKTNSASRASALAWVLDSNSEWVFSSPFA